MCFKQTSKPKRLLEAYADADYFNDIVTQSSTTGYIITVGCAAVCWRTRKQCAVALSSTEAEYMAMNDCSKHIVWFRRLLFILTQAPLDPTPINLAETSFFNDNNGTIFLSEEAALNARSKHIQIRNHYFRQLVRDKIIAP